VSRVTYIYPQWPQALDGSQLERELPFGNPHVAVVNGALNVTIDDDGIDHKAQIATLGMQQVRPPRKQPKSFAARMAIVQGLSPADRQLLISVALAELLVRKPKIGQLANLNIDGEETV